MNLRFGIHAKLLAIVGVLTTISVLLATGTWFYLTSQKGGTNTINIAGRQRMLSQKMAKEALLLAGGDGHHAQNTCGEPWHCSRPRTMGCSRGMRS